MRVLGLVCTACVILCQAGCSGKSNADKIVGKWEVSKTGDAQGAPVGAVVDFQKDGKLGMTMKILDKEMTMNGTYKVDGDKLTITMKGLDGKEQSETNTIKSLDDTTMVLIEKDKKETEFKKKK